MARFDPQPGDTLEIEQAIYTVMPHPGAPMLAFGQEGRKAIVYQVANHGHLFALKIFKQPYRLPWLMDTCHRLAAFKTMAGLEVCARLCLTAAIAPGLLRQYPEMEYAVLMPWVEGTTWFDIIYQKMAVTQELSIQLAQRLAGVLAGLEEKRLAHCDLAAPNVIVNVNAGAVSLIDVEDMYGHGFALTGAFPAGTAGYQHRSVSANVNGQWCPEGDRFAGAVLLTEMLVWHNATIRQRAGEEHFFQSDELHNNKSENYQQAVELLFEISSTMGNLFVQAWTSPTLADCPSLQSWSQGLQAAAPALSSQSSLLGSSTVSTNDHPSPPTRYSPAWISLTPDPTPLPALSPTIGRTTAKLERPVLTVLARATVGEEVIIRWQTIWGATTYELQVAENDLLAQSGIFKTVFQGGQTRYTMRYDTPRHCYFRVRAQAGQGPDGDWSETVQVEISQDNQKSKLKVVPGVIETPTWCDAELITWDASTFGQTKVVKVEICWHKTALPTTYELEYTDPTDAKRIEHLIQTHRSLELPLGYHLFRVRATNQQNDKSAWSTKLTITVEKKQWWHRKPHVDIHLSKF